MNENEWMNEKWDWLIGRLLTHYQKRKYIESKKSTVLIFWCDLEIT